MIIFSIPSKFRVKFSIISNLLGSSLTHRIVEQNFILEAQGQGGGHQIHEQI